MSEHKPILECTDSEIGALLMSYSLGTLSDADVERFELHLLHCPACQQEMESASLELNTLVEAREQFVLRAHQENEDFESQYERLKRDTQLASPGKRTAKSQSWLENFWEVIWGRKWVIGTAGAVVIAAMFVLRQGPELTQPTAVKKEIASDYNLLSPMKSGGAADTSLTQPNQQQVGLREAEIQDVPLSLSRPKLLEKQKSVAPVGKETPSPRSGQPSMIGESEEVLTDSDIEPVEVIAAQEIVVLKSEVQLDVVQKSTSIDRESLISAPATDYSRIAEITLGKFDPNQYSNLYDAQEADSPAAMTGIVSKAPGFKLDGLADRRSIGNADTLVLKQSQAETTERYESEGKIDAAEVSLQITAGMAALTSGDYANAKSFLEAAYNHLPQSAKKNDVGLLLARTYLHAGQFEGAENLLFNISQAESDSTRKAFVQKAITTLDSVKRTETLKQIPK